MPVDGRFAGGRGDVDDRAGPALAHAGQRGLGRADGAHQVDLPGALPDLLGELVEAVDLGPADVVDEAVDAAERLERRRRSTRSRLARVARGRRRRGGRRARRRRRLALTTFAPSACEQARRRRGRCPRSRP